MLKQFSLRMPGRVFGGNGSLAEIENIVRGKSRIAVFTDKGIEGSGLLELPLEWIRKAGAESVVLDELPTEPTYAQAQETIERFRETGAEMILAAGGGSVMDIAKLASIAATDDYTVKGYAGSAADRQKTDRDASDSDDGGYGLGSHAEQYRRVPEKELKVDRQSGNDGGLRHPGQHDDQKASAEDCGGYRD